MKLNLKIQSGLQILQDKGIQFYMTALYVQPRKINALNVHDSAIPFARSEIKFDKFDSLFYIRESDISEDHKIDVVFLEFYDPKKFRYIKELPWTCFMSQRNHEQQSVDGLTSIIMSPHNLSNGRDIWDRGQISNVTIPVALETALNGLEIMWPHLFRLD